MIALLELGAILEILLSGFQNHCNYPGFVKGGVYFRTRSLKQGVWEMQSPRSDRVTIFHRAKMIPIMKFASHIVT